MKPFKHSKHTTNSKRDTNVTTAFYKDKNVPLRATQRNEARPEPFTQINQYRAFSQEEHTATQRLTSTRPCFSQYNTSEGLNACSRRRNTPIPCCAISTPQRTCSGTDNRRKYYLYYFSRNLQCLLILNEIMSMSKTSIITRNNLL